MAMKGMNVLNRRLGSIAQAISNNSFEEAATEWIEQDFKPVARRECPVDTGELRDSIGGSVNQNQGRVFASADHASIVHDGTSTREGNPFLDRAFEQTRRKLSGRMRKKLRNALS